MGKDGCGTEGELPAASGMEGCFQWESPLQVRGQWTWVELNCGAEWSQGVGRTPGTQPRG